MTASEVLFEYVQVGPQMRVAAIDAESGIEVVVICPLSASKLQMQRLALGKLHKKLSATQPTATQRLF